METHINQPSFTCSQKVIELPIRDGNTITIANHNITITVIELPIRDGN